MTEFGRRGFLKTLFGGAAAAVAGTMLDPEKLLWIPGAKTIFLPAGDIAIKNVRAATMAEQAQITGEHLLRIKYRAAKSQGGVVLLGESRHAYGGSLRVEEVIVVPEKQFATQGLSLLEGATDIEVHFDDGSVAHGVKVASTLAEIREKARQHQQAQVVRQAQERGYLKGRADFGKTERRRFDSFLWDKGGAGEDRPALVQDVTRYPAMTTYELKEEKKS